VPAWVALVAADNREAALAGELGQVRNDRDERIYKSAAELAATSSGMR
jgi:hypothetical protein